MKIKELYEVCKNLVNEGKGNNDFWIDVNVYHGDFCTFTEHNINLSLSKINCSISGKIL